MTRHAFRELGLHRLEANIQPSNESSIALVRSCGFKKEGYSPAYLKLGGKWRDQDEPVIMCIATQASEMIGWRDNSGSARPFQLTGGPIF